MSKICALQLPTLPMSDARLDFYFRICADKGVKLVAIGEYVLNSFFKELETMPMGMIKAQSEQKKQSISTLSKKYDLTVVAPVVSVRAGKPVKFLAKFSPAQNKFCEQKILMPYAHWNEAKFYANEASGGEILTFNCDKLKVGVVSGFEAHFDACWQALASKKVDLVVVPTASTFETHARWEELLKMRAFTHNVYVLRVNRIGAYKQKGANGEQWSFYGDSFLINPFGEICERLGANEEMMIVEPSKKELSNARSLWGFNALGAKFSG